MGALKYGRAKRTSLTRPCIRHYFCCGNFAVLDSAFESKSFLVLLSLISIAFVWLILPFYGAIFWAVILAILFAPLQARIVRRCKQRESLAALITLVLILLLVILPVIFLTVSMLQEGSMFYQRVRSGEFNFSAYFLRVMDALPPFAQQLLVRLELFDTASIQDRLASSLMLITQFMAERALVIGQNTLSFVVRFVIMLYLLFFLLRDGKAMVARLYLAIPLGADYRHLFLQKFATVIKATVKGNLIISVIQGILGGFIFWALDVQGAILWGFVMAVLSLLPAVGASLIWGPVAIYFLATGAFWQGIILVAFGAIVIGLIDNLLRPVLVGRDTQMPDYLVLISTLGGLTLLGLNGFVIGPLIAALFIAAWGLFTDTRKPELQQTSAADISADDN